MLKKSIWLLPFLSIIFMLPALAGPLLLDDSIHLGPIIAWLSDRQNTFNLIFGNTSGTFGRPVSILSFILNAMTSGASIWPMKLTNLLLHLATGLCLAKLLYRLFSRDANLADQAKLASIAAASLWLVLPQHISTIFYLIQRMTILAALFAVLACWFYVIARERFEAGDRKAFSFFVGTGVLTVLSILSKESGLLIPLYLLLIELLYFRPTPEKPRPKIILWAFRLGVIYPCLLVAAYLAFNPEFVLGPYTDRAFSMPERALTQISVVADYLASTFLPMARSAGLFNDDFPIAHALSLHEMTLLLAGSALVILAILLRKKYVSFSAGIGLFFIGHLLESTIFSLEIYFSHRNYLPSMGLILAAWGLLAGLMHRHSAMSSFKKMSSVAFAVMFVAYGLASFSRATVWSDKGSLLSHSQKYHPASSRLRSELLLASLYAGRTDLALQQADLALHTAPPNEKRGIQLWRMLAYCYAQAPMPAAELEALSSMSADRITLATNTALVYVSSAAEANACPGLDRVRLGKLTAGWAINTVQYQGSHLVWKTHLSAARLLASGGDLEAGFKQAEWAFTDSGYTFDAGLLAYQLANSLEDGEQSRKIMSLLIANQVKYTERQQAMLQTLTKS